MLATVVRIGVIAVALWVATVLVPGIELEAGSTVSRIGTLLAVALVFGVVNAVIKPIVQVLGCAFYILTLGLIAFVVNALLFLLVGRIAGALGLPFSVDGFCFVLGRDRRRAGLAAAAVAGSGPSSSGLTPAFTCRSPPQPAACAHRSGAQRMRGESLV